MTLVCSGKPDLRRKALHSIKGEMYSRVRNVAELSRVFTKYGMRCRVIGAPHCIREQQSAKESQNNEDRI